MSDPAVQTYYDSDPKARESTDPYQSAWMAHWMRTTPSASRVHNQISVHDKCNEDDHDTKQISMLAQTDEPWKVTRLDMDVSPGSISEYRNHQKCRQGLEIASDVPQHAKGFGVLTEARRVEILNENLAMNSKNLRSARSDWQPFPMFNIDKNRETILAPKKDPTVGDRFAFRSQIDDNSGYNTIHVGTSERHSPSIIPASAPSEIEFSSRGCNFQPEGILQSPEQWVNPHKFLDKNSLPVSRPFQAYLKGSNSNIMPRGLKTRGTPEPFFVDRGKETDQLGFGLASKEHSANTNFTPFGHEQCNYHKHSKLMVCEKKIDDQLNSRNCETSYLGRNDGALLLHDPSTSNYPYPTFFEQHQKMRKLSGIELLPSHRIPPGVTESEELSNGCKSLPKISSVHGVETMRICTTVDSVTGVRRGLSKFSETTHHLLFTKKTDVNLTKGCQMIRESTISTEFKRNAFSKLVNLPPDVGFHGKQVAKLQPRENTEDSQGQEDAWDAKTCELGLKNNLPLDVGFHGKQVAKLQPRENSEDSQLQEDAWDAKTCELGLKNESSADTDTMDIGDFQVKNHLQGMFPNANHSKNVREGVALCPSNKVLQDVMGGKNLATVPLPREKVGSRQTETELPDINQEPPSPSAASGSMADRELSSSKTESLDVEHLLAHGQQPGNSISSFRNDDPPLDPEPSSRWVKRMGPELSSRWVKRLKLGVSESIPHGTKSLKMGEASSSENVNKLFSEVMNYRRTSPDPKLGKHLGKGQMGLDQTMVLLRNSEPSSTDSVKEDRDIMLSHSWIRRWCRNQTAAPQTPQMKSTTVVVCEPQSSKTASDEFQGKQFPSIDAVALMGKAMNGFRPCEFRKRGSFVVWNTEGF
ncbi:hypothetical protein HHK36_010156 [Tetracentron sinense]|uniref:F-box family protein n=1 Tax=Tetracentron sinense TaxID=13715 RepID=A0A834ZGE6_TETSI|nr:hypothetical protein HHK36_010156 [Tetracentron sinense]